MLSVRKGCPLNYRLCNQTVTVYHYDQEMGRITRTLITNGAFLDRKKTQNVDRTGLSEASSFLLVIPGGKQSVFPGDKVYAGIGQEVNTLTQWRDFIPANVPDLCVVKYADVKHWNGSIVHTEAGG